VDRGAVDAGCVGHAKAGPGRDEPREVGRRADGRRSCVRQNHVVL